MSNQAEQPKAKRARGTGSVYRIRNGTVWHIKYYDDRGIPHRESSHSSDENVAEKLLKRRLAECLTGTFVPRRNIRVDELLDDVFADYKDRGHKSLENTEARWKLHLAKHFTRLRACDLTTAHLRRYITARREQEEASAATINRELALLRRAFKLGAEATPPKVTTVPHFPMLRESDARHGFVESAQYDRLAAECSKIGLWMRAIFEAGYAFGWRLHELTGKPGLLVEQVNLIDNTIRLHPGSTKNDLGREVQMTPTVRELLTMAVHGKKKPKAPVFTREDGQPVVDFRKAWHGVCIRAGVGELVCPECNTPVNQKRHCAVCGRKWKANRLRYSGLLFHDLRRTAVRNMVRAGVPEKVAMQISGHKTREIFDRYHIVAPADLREAALKVENYQQRERQTLQKAKDAEEFGQSSGNLAREMGQKPTSGTNSATHHTATTILPN